MSTPARIPAENLTGARLAVRLAALALLTGLLVSISLAAPLSFITAANISADE